MRTTTRTVSRAPQRGPGLVLFAFLLGFGPLNAQPPAPKPAVTASASPALLPAFRAGPMRGVNDIVFAARALNQTDGHWYANFGYYAHDSGRKAYAEGGKLYRFSLATRTLTE